MRPMANNHPGSPDATDADENSPQAGDHPGNPRKVPARRRRTVPLDAVTLLKFLLGTDPKIETALLCPPSHVQYVTSDAALYQAVGSLKPYDDVHTNKIAKLLEITIIVPQPKWPLTHARVDELRAHALKANAGEISRQE
jgi:hypothetical protein